MEIHRKVVEVNYFGMVGLVKALLQALRKSGDGLVMQVSSVQGSLSVPHRAAYSASKHAMQAYSDSLRAEEAAARTGVEVSVFSPGYVNTNIAIRAFNADGSQRGENDANHTTGYEAEDVASRIVEAIILREKEVLMAPFHVKLAVFIRKFIPSLYFVIMKNRAVKTNPKNKVE